MAPAGGQVTASALASMRNTITVHAVFTRS
jgi:hypothetical protein